MAVSLPSCKLSVVYWWECKGPSIEGWQGAFRHTLPKSSTKSRCQDCTKAGWGSRGILNPYVCSACSAYTSTLKKEAVGSSGTSADLYQYSQRITSHKKELLKMSTVRSRDWTSTVALRHCCSAASRIAPFRLSLSSLIYTVRNGRRRNCSLLGCMPTFRSNLLPPFSVKTKDALSRVAKMVLDLSPLTLFQTFVSTGKLLGD
jgi:hypothetical protein